MSVPLLIGARGRFSADAHENVIPSLNAAPPWADGVYINVRTTSDGVPVLMHDATVQRTTNGVGAVDSLTLAQIQALDAGDGAQVPTLAEYLAAIRDTIDVEAAAGDRRPFQLILLNAADETLAGVTAAHNVAMDAAFAALHDRYMWVWGLGTSTTGAVNLRSLDAAARIGTWHDIDSASDATTIMGLAASVDADTILAFPESWNAFPEGLEIITGQGYVGGISRADGSPAATQTVPMARNNPHISIVITSQVDEFAWWHAPDPQDQRATVVEAITGSHQVVAEARLLAGYQTAENPDGDDLPIVDGEVIFDASADVMATLSLTIPGVDQVTGRPWHPSHVRSKLAPYGAEVWVRRGIDLGDEVLWVPLGVFRITDLDQDDAPDGPIQIEGQDRMRGIIRARLLTPRVYPADTTAGDMAEDLVREVYPAAVIMWDDATNLEQIGRQIVVEQDRYAALRELADSYGKLCYWDGLGILRIEDPPSADEIVWEVRAGRKGVLLRASDSVTDESAYNAVVATGEGVSGTLSAARGVALDRGVNSPTRWGGPHGMVPYFFASPLLQTSGQAQRAAVTMLRRMLGADHTVSLGAVVNPLLRPHQTVRVTLRDGTRRRHVIRQCTVPLTAGSPMTAATQEQTHTVVEAVIT